MLPAPLRMAAATADDAAAIGRVKGATGDHYAVLGVDRGAGDEEVRRAYRRLAVQLHPDKNPHPDADEAFKTVGAAYSVLSDARRRADYDKYGEDGPDIGSGFFDFEEMFGGAFNEFDLFAELFADTEFAFLGRNRGKRRGGPRVKQHEWTTTSEEREERRAELEEERREKEEQQRAAKEHEQRRRAATGTKPGEGEAQVTLKRQKGERLGLEFAEDAPSDGVLVITGVERGTPADRHNCGRYIGWQLAHLDGVELRSAADARPAMEKGGRKITLRFRRRGGG